MILWGKFESDVGDRNNEIGEIFGLKSESFQESCRLDTTETSYNFWIDLNYSMGLFIKNICCLMIQIEIHITKREKKEIKTVEGGGGRGVVLK